MSRRGRRNFRRAWRRNAHGVGEMVRVWLALPAGHSPDTRARELAQQAFLNRDAVSREMAALRAVQSLSVLDVRNYRDLVFRLGAFEADGEDPALARSLP